jgi:hypothetical protein
MQVGMGFWPAKALLSVMMPAVTVPRSDGARAPLLGRSGQRLMPAFLVYGDLIALPVTPARIRWTPDGHWTPVIADGRLWTVAHVLSMRKRLLNWCGSEGIAC